MAPPSPVPSTQPAASDPVPGYSPADPNVIIPDPLPEGTVILTSNNPPHVNIPDQESQYNQIELSAGFRYNIGDTFLAGLGIGGYPLSWLYLGAFGGSNFSTKHSILGEVGFRLRPSQIISVQPTLMGGVAIQDEYEIVSGDLKENILLSGAAAQFGADVRLMIDPLPWLGLSLTAGLMMEEQSSLEATPATLVSGEDPKSFSVFPTVGFGIRFDFVPTTPTYTTIALVKKEKVVVEPDPLPAEPEKPFDERVEERKQKIVEFLKAQGKESEAEELAQNIDKFKGQLNTFSDHLNIWGDGINVTHLLAERFQRTLDALSADPKTALDNDLEKKVDLILEASLLNDEKKYASKTRESRGIRVGVRLGYPATQEAYGKKLVTQLKEIEGHLKERPEDEGVHQKVKKAIVFIEDYLKNYKENIQIKHLDDEQDKIKPAQWSLESQASRAGLDENEDWKALQEDFVKERDFLTDYSQSIQKDVRLFALFMSDANEFGDVVRTPEAALTTFQKANELIENEQIRFDPLNDVDFVNYLSYQTDHFITTHSSPKMEETAAKTWEASVDEAKKLMKRINPHYGKPADPINTW